ncbi:hypothetical protein S83_002278, partial [Arachis hypogaea]
SSPPSRNTAPPRSFGSPMPPVMSSNSVIMSILSAPPSSPSFRSLRRFSTPPSIF